MKYIRTLGFQNAKSIKFGLALFFTCSVCSFSQIVRTPIGQSSSPVNSEISLKLIKRIQSYNPIPKDKVNDIFERAIFSPKSVHIIKEKSKVYINSLEGCETVVYDLNTFKRIKVIKHKFDNSNAHLFSETYFPGYVFRTRNSNFNNFSGKPVEMCTSHNNKFLWVPYYRRNYDQNAVDPSAVAIIDTDTDDIVRVIPTAPLPKMVACSPDNKYIAITNWGDNTVHLIDVNDTNVNKFRYIKHFVVDKKLSLNFDKNKLIDRDFECGFCLRGTVFTPDGKYLLVGRMSCKGGIAFFDIDNMKYMGTVYGCKESVRHLIIKNDFLYLSSNNFGIVQRTKLNDIVEFAKGNIGKKDTIYNKWENVFTGLGARTITSDSNGKYIFATANNESKVSVVRTQDMKVISRIPTDSYPVGMDYDENKQVLVVTSQGKNGSGGNSVMFFKVEKK